MRVTKGYPSARRGKIVETNAREIARLLIRKGPLRPNNVREQARLSEAQYFRVVKVFAHWFAKAGPNLVLTDAGHQAAKSE